MNHDHLMLVSEQDLPSGKSGMSELFEQFPPRRVLPLFAGSLSKHPDVLRDHITDAGGTMLDPYRLTPLGSERIRSKKDSEELPYTVFSEMQTALLENLPEHLSKAGSETPLVILIASGSGFHSSLMFTLGLAIRNAIFVTVDQFMDEERQPIVASQLWIHDAMTVLPQSQVTRDALRMMLIQTADRRNCGNLDGWMTAEQVVGGLSSANATGFSNSAEILVNSQLISVKEEAQPIKYRLTGRGWVVAMRLLTDMLENSGVALHGADKTTGERLAERFMRVAQDDASGRIMGIRAVLQNGELRACNVRQSLHPVDVGLSLYWRRRDQMRTQLVVDDNEFEIEEDSEILGTFTEAHLAWKRCSGFFGDEEELSWALADIEGPEGEECFRELCQWLWPWITGYEHIASDSQKRQVNWQMDITQLGMQQALLANLFGTIWGPVPMTYVFKRSGGKGERDGEVRSSTASNCVITLPNHRLVRNLLDIEGKPDRGTKVLVALQVWSEIRAAKLAQTHEDLASSDPFADDDADEIPPEKVTIVQLERLLAEEGVPEKLQLDSSENTGSKDARLRKMQEFAVRKLEHSLIEVDRSGTPWTLGLTPLGKIVALRLLHRHSDEDE
jgi:hypothetical protein